MHDDRSSKCNLMLPQQLRVYLALALNCEIRPHPNQSAQLASHYGCQLASVRRDTCDSCRRQAVEVSGDH